MKNLFKQYRELEASIKESKGVIKNMEGWDNKTSHDFNEMEQEKSRLEKANGKMIVLLQKIHEASGKELKQREHEYTASLQSA